MNKGILNQTSLEKNIEQLKLYASEEKASLTKIINQIKEIPKSYKSENTNLLLNNTNNLTTNIDFIFQKRINYTKVLNEVIIQYNELANYTLQSFEKDV